jgi:hypothetical protein
VRAALVYNSPIHIITVAVSAFKTQPMSLPQRDYCSLCGIYLSSGHKRRLYCASEARKFIVERCKPTPFLYKTLTSEDGCPLPARANSVCIPCVNWKRRAESGALKRTKQPLLQLDQLILFLMQPGRHHEPDHRCMERLVKAVRQMDNPYRHIFPLPVLSISLNIKDNTYQHCITAWWEYNGKTEFFASSHEARRVRCAIKAGLMD